MEHILLPPLPLAVRILKAAGGEYKAVGDRVYRRLLGDVWFEIDRCFGPITASRIAIELNSLEP